MVERDKDERPWIRVRYRRSSIRSMGDRCIVGDKKGNRHEGSKHKGKFEEIKITADSGAVDHVASKKAFKGYPVSESPGSKVGLNYVTANNSELPNEGQQRVLLLTGEGHRCSTTFQTCEVNRPILSVARLTEHGHRVTFREDGSGGQIKNTKTGQVAEFIRKDGAYVVTMWVAPGPFDNEKVAPVFHRQG